jgi:hypothetical protein
MKLLKYIFCPNWETIYYSSCEITETFSNPYYGEINSRNKLLRCNLQYSKNRNKYRIISTDYANGYDTTSAYTDCLDKKIKMKEIKL